LLKLLTTVEKNSKPCADSKSLWYAFKPAIEFASNAAVGASKLCWEKR